LINPFRPKLSAEFQFYWDFLALFNKTFLMKVPAVTVCKIDSRLLKNIIHRIDEDVGGEGGDGDDDGAGRVSEVDDGVINRVQFQSPEKV
jgi:hypothetical protein